MSGTCRGHVGDRFYPGQVFIETMLGHFDKVLAASKTVLDVSGTHPRQCEDNQDKSQTS